MPSPAKYDIGRRVKKFFPNYRRYFTGYVVGTSEPGEEDDDSQEEMLYTIYYPEDTDEETMTEAQVSKWDDGTLGDDGDDNLGSDEVVESDLLGSLLRAYYLRHAHDAVGDDRRAILNAQQGDDSNEKPTVAEEPTVVPQSNAKSDSRAEKEKPARQSQHKYRPGQRVSKYFVREGAYFSGTIDELVHASELHTGIPGVNYYHVKYDDGDKEHLAEAAISSIVIQGDFAPGYAAGDGDEDNDKDDDESDESDQDDDEDYIYASEDDTKPPARKRNRMSNKEKLTTANDTSADAKYATEWAAAEAGENCEYIEGGRTFEARVVDHRLVMSGGEESKPILKFLVEWRRKVDVAAATAEAAAGAGSLADSDSDSTSSSSAAAAMEIDTPAVALNTPPLSSSWLRLDEFIAPSAALAYLNNNTSLPAWEKEGLVKDVSAFRDALERDNIFETLKDEPSSCGEIDFCCYVCRCGGHSLLGNQLAKCQNVSKYHRGCCHSLDTKDKLESFLSSLGRVQERFLKQTTADDYGGGSDDDDCIDKAVLDYHASASASLQPDAAGKKYEEDKKMQRHLNNVLDSRKRSAIARESRSDNDLALAAPESQRWTDETAVAVHKRFQQVCKVRRESPNLKREAVVLEVFAGIGGAAVALKKLGIAVKRNIVVEHDRAALAVHRYNHDSAYGSGIAQDDGVEYIYSLYETYEELEANIQRIVREQGPIDIIIGGPPCQDHSKVNARRMGADGMHGRYMRDFPTLISLIQKYNRELHSFDELFFLVENVPGSQDATADYKVSEYRCDAANFGPCHRDRVFYFNWQPDSFPADEHPAGGSTCFTDGWIMPTMFQKGIDAKAMTLLASKGRTMDKTLFKFRIKDNAPAINPGEDRPASHVGDRQLFDTNDRERLMGLPVGYVEQPIEDLFVNLRRASTVGLEAFEAREWRDVVPPMYWTFVGLGPGGFTHTIDDSFELNDPRRIAFALQEKNQRTKVCLKDYHYGWHLIGNGFSIPQVVFLLRPLQQLFQSREYPGYTDTKFAWEEDDESEGNGDKEQEVVAPRQEPNDSAENTEHRDDGGDASAAIAKIPVEIPKEKAHGIDIDSSDDEYSL